MNINEKIQKELENIEKNQSQIIVSKQKIKRSEETIKKLKQQKINELTKDITFEQLAEVLEKNKEEKKEGESI